jgi:glucosamine--fructose-6-phosphate aminotransferase (isomerizing)
MCGIFGFLGTKCFFKYSINGLKQLQNRGYDSAGCCGIRKLVIEPKETDKTDDSKDQKECEYEMIVRKYATKKDGDSIDTLEKDADLFENCEVGISHTRWATHGAKTDANAHPHLDYKDRIALVHNGIIENYYELKKELEVKHKIKFRSETDTEVIVNLISIYYDQSEDSDGVKHMEQAIMKAVSRLSGTWALIVISKEKPDNIYCARRGSSLLIGFGDCCIMVTSEQAGFNSYVTNYVQLDDDDITVIRKRNGKINFENIENYELRKVTVGKSELTPEPFEHWTLKEIHEQYAASVRAINFGGRILESNKINLGGLVQREAILKKITHLLLLGCGTSLNAAQHAVHFFKDLCEFTTVQAFDGSEFLKEDIPKKGKVCAVFLSQSGETKDLYRCIEICRSNNVFTVGVVNVVDSLIARNVDCGCYLNAGREVGVASTKAFTSQVILLSMLAIYFAQINNLNSTKREYYIKCLRQLPTDIKKIFHTTDDTNISKETDFKKKVITIDDMCKEIAEYLITQKDLFVLGKGSMVSVASEGSLKTKEIGYIHAESYGGNALRHGPYAVIEKGTPIIFLNPNDTNYDLMNNTIEEVKTRDACPIVISDSKDVSRHASYKIQVPSNNVYKGILHNIPMQLISYYMALKKGHNPDMPKNLSKCVTV